MSAEVRVDIATLDSLAAALASLSASGGCMDSAALWLHSYVSRPFLRM